MVRSEFFCQCWLLWVYNIDLSVTIEVLKSEIVIESKNRRGNDVLVYPKQSYVSINAD